MAQFRAVNNSNFGTAAYVASLDADNSGVIDQFDLGQFRQRNNSSVFPMTPGGTPMAVPVPAPLPVPIEASQLPGNPVDWASAIAATKPNSGLYVDLVAMADEA